MFKTLSKVRSIFVGMILVLGSSYAPASYIIDTMQTKLDVYDSGLQISVYESKNDSSFYQPTSVNVPAIDVLQNKVRALTDVDPYFLLNRQRAIFASVGFTQFLPRFDLVLKQKIFPISFLEEILFELHSEKMNLPLFDSYSEFGANILVGPNGELAILFISNPHDASVPDTETRKKVLKEYLAKGYKYKIHIHNHPFNFTNTSGDIAGTPIPSGDKEYGDVGVYLNERKAYQLENGWITNGFNTLRIEASDFDKY